MNLYITCCCIENIFVVLYKLFNLQTASFAQGKVCKMQRRICKKWVQVLNLVPCCFNEKEKLQGSNNNNIND